MRRSAWPAAATVGLMPFPPRRTRLLAVVAAMVFLAVALGIRALGNGRLLDSSGGLAQYSGTALYASMVYAAVLFGWPRTTATQAFAATFGWCWLVELFQLTGIPAVWSTHNLAARLALGVVFDPIDLVWYLVGVVLLAAVHGWVAGGAAPKTATGGGAAGRVGKPP